MFHSTFLFLSAIVLLLCHQIVEDDFGIISNKNDIKVSNKEVTRITIKNSETTLSRVRYGVDTF